MNRERSAAPWAWLAALSLFLAFAVSQLQLEPGNDQATLGSIRDTRLPPNWSAVQYTTEPLPASIAAAESGIGELGYGTFTHEEHDRITVDDDNSLEVHISIAAVDAGSTLAAKGMRMRSAIFVLPSQATVTEHEPCLYTTLTDGTERRRPLSELTGKTMSRSSNFEIDYHAVECAVPYLDVATTAKLLPGSVSLEYSVPAIVHDRGTYTSLELKDGTLFAATMPGCNECHFWTEYQGTRQLDVALASPNREFVDADPPTIDFNGGHARFDWGEDVTLTWKNTQLETILGFLRDAALLLAGTGFAFLAERLRRKGPAWKIFVLPIVALGLAISIISVSPAVSTLVLVTLGIAVLAFLDELWWRIRKNLKQRIPT